MSRHCTSCDGSLPADAPSYAKLCKPCFALSKRLEVQQLHHQIDRLETEVRRLRALAVRAPAPTPLPFDLARGRQLLQLCHPDRHDGSDLAHRVTSWLLDARKNMETAT